MIHPEAQSFRLLYPARTPCQSVVSCTSAGKHGTDDSATLGLFSGFGPCQADSCVRKCCPCLHLMPFAATDDLRSHPRLHWRLQPCDALRLQGPFTLSWAVSAKRNQPVNEWFPQGQFVQEIQRVFNSFFLFIIDRMMSWFLKGKYAYFSLLTILLRPDVWDFLSYYAILTVTAQS